MRKSKRRYFIMLVILIMLALIVALIPTLSKYLTKVEGESTINIARWEIKVNSQSIRENKDNILLSIKDTGTEFNPVVEKEDMKFDNLLRL